MVSLQAGIFPWYDYVPIRENVDYPGYPFPYSKSDVYEYPKWDTRVIDFMRHGSLAFLSCYIQSSYVHSPEQRYTVFVPYKTPGLDKAVYDTQKQGYDHNTRVSHTKGNIIIQRQLRRHIINYKINPNQLDNETYINTLEDDTIYIDRYGFINNTKNSIKKSIVFPNATLFFIHYEL